MKNKVLLFSSILLLTYLLVGCTSSKFDSKYKQFKESYILATNFVEKDNDSFKALKKIDLNSFEVELEKMKGAMDNMIDKSNSKDENEILGNLKNYYQGLEFLLYANKNFDKLTMEERIKVDTEVIFASMNRKSIKRGEEWVSLQANTPYLN